MAKNLRRADLGSGRANQKARTREALVDAAITLVRKGEAFAVGDVADLAGVSRTTAYNYFPTIEALYAQAVLAFITRNDYPDFYERFGDTHDVAARVRAVVETNDASIERHEQLYRGVLRVSVDASRDADVPHRPRFRPRWFADALEPLRERLDPDRFERLVNALCLCAGVEAHVTLRDVCGLSPDDALRTKLWAAQALLQAATSGTA
jgi:AcrR family transcriptional regulator